MVSKIKIILYPINNINIKIKNGNYKIRQIQSTKTQTITLLMTIRSDSEFRRAKPKGKLGSFVGLKLLYRGIKK
jgi:hypothetical protein